MTATIDRIEPGRSDLAVTFLAQGEQRADDVLARLEAFIAHAERSLDFALYDVRLSEPHLARLAAALRERAGAGVAIRFAYDADKPEQPDLARGMDPAAAGTGRSIQSLGYPWRRIGGMKLMHHKYIVRDAGLPAARVWTGSTNFTDDSWTLQENNIVEIASPQVADYYARNFEELWQEENFERSGDFDTDPVQLRYQGEEITIKVLFSPCRGTTIDEDVATRVNAARRRIRICSMLLNSGTLLAALCEQLDEERVPMSGVYDRTQQADVLKDWEAVPKNHWKIPAIEYLVNSIPLVGKNSRRYAPDTPHDFMHSKVLLLDDTVLTGSYNFSRSATLNAENILMIESPALAEEYSAYVDHLIAKYQAGSRPL